jgi:hypothetical protein
MEKRRKKRTKKKEMAAKLQKSKLEQMNPDKKLESIRS